MGIVSVAFFVRLFVATFLILVSLRRNCVCGLLGNFKAQRGGERRGSAAKGILWLSVIFLFTKRLSESLKRD